MLNSYEWICEDAEANLFSGSWGEVEDRHIHWQPLFPRSPTWSRSVQVAWLLFIVHGDGISLSRSFDLGFGGEPHQVLVSCSRALSYNRPRQTWPETVLKQSLQAFSRTTFIRSRQSSRPECFVLLGARPAASPIDLRSIPIDSSYCEAILRH